MGKQCSLCQEHKPLSDYTPNKRLEGGYNHRCKSCSHAYRDSVRCRHKSMEQAWNELVNVYPPRSDLSLDKETPIRKRSRSEIRDYKNTRMRRRYKENASYRQYVKDYKAKNADQCRLNSSNWRQRNPEKVRETNLLWRQANPEKIRAYRHTRRAREAGNGGSYTDSELQILEASQGGLCAYCQREGQILHVDHVIPLKQGGTSYIANIALACRKCNLNKHAKTPEQWVDRWYLRESVA